MAMDVTDGTDSTGGYDCTGLVLVALEGPDGVGKSMLARALTGRLRGLVNAGYVSLFQHTRPPAQIEDGPLTRHAWYAGERLLHPRCTRPTSGRFGITVADRWWHSSLYLARADLALSKSYGHHPETWARITPALEAERAAWDTYARLTPALDAERVAWRARNPGVVLVPVRLDAPDDVLDARIAKRLAEGRATAADLHAQHALRQAYRAGTTAPGMSADYGFALVVDTAGTLRETIDTLTAGVLERLRLGGLVVPAGQTLGR